jgi:hypothetical protein
MAINVTRRKKLNQLMPEGFELYGAHGGDNHRNQKNQSSDKKCYRRTQMLVTRYTI